MFVLLYLFNKLQMEDKQDKQKITSHAMKKQQLQTNKIRRQILYQQCRLVILSIIKKKQADKMLLIQMLEILIKDIGFRTDRLKKACKRNLQNNKLIEEQISLFTQCIKSAKSYLETQSNRINLLQTLYSQLINVYIKYCSVLPLQYVSIYFEFYEQLCKHPEYFKLKITQQSGSFDMMICGIVLCFNISLKYSLQIIQFSKQSQELLISYYQNNEPKKRSFKLRTYFYQFYKQFKQTMQDKLQLILKRMLIRLCQEQISKHNNQIICKCKQRCPQIQGFSSFQTQNKTKGCLNKGFRFFQLAYLFFGNSIVITKFRFCCQIRQGQLQKFFSLLKRGWQVIIEQNIHVQLCIQKKQEGCTYQNGKIRKYQDMKNNANYNYSVIKKLINKLDPKQQKFIEKCDNFLVQTSFQPFNIILMTKAKETQLKEMLSFQNSIKEQYQKQQQKTKPNRVVLISKFVSDSYKIYEILPSLSQYQSYISFFTKIGHSFTQAGNAIKQAFSDKGTQSLKIKTVKTLKIQRQQDLSQIQYVDYLKS